MRIIFSLTILGVTGLCVGWMAWNTGFHGVIILPVVVVVAACLPGRSRTFIFMLGYYSGSTVELLRGAMVFFDSQLFQAAIIWTFLQFVLALGWIIIKWDHQKNFSRVFWQIAGTFVITVFIPPYTFLGMAHPVTAAGYYFPFSGYPGIVMYLLLVTVIACRVLNIFPKKKTACLLLIILVLSITNNHFEDRDKRAKISQDWICVNTQLRRYPSNDSQQAYLRQLRLKALAEEHIRDGKKVIIFPESIAGMLREPEENLWGDIDLLAKKHGAHILLGGYLLDSVIHYDNIMLMLGEKDIVSQNVLSARISMPVTNWRPFLSPSSRLHIGIKDNGVESVAGKTTAFLICYEQALVWPVLQSMAGSKKPDVIVAVSNLWWAKDTGIPKIMENICNLWGRLFDVPVVRAVNL